MQTAKSILKVGAALVGLLLLSVMLEGISPETRALVIALVSVAGMLYAMERGAQARHDALMRRLDYLVEQSRPNESGY